MSGVRRGVVAVTTGLALTFGSFAVASPASAADSPNCVTRKEFRQVHRGMTKHRVHRIFDVNGRFADGFAGGYTRRYVMCARRFHLSHAYVNYRAPRHRPHRVIGKHIGI